MCSIKKDFGQLCSDLMAYKKKSQEAASPQTERGDCISYEINNGVGGAQVNSMVDGQI